MSFDIFDHRSRSDREEAEEWREAERDRRRAENDAAWEEIYAQRDQDERDREEREARRRSDGDSGTSWTGGNVEAPSWVGVGILGAIVAGIATGAATAFADPPVTSDYQVELFVALSAVTAVFPMILAARTPRAVGPVSLALVVALGATVYACQQQESASITRNSAAVEAYVRSLNASPSVTAFAEFSGTVTAWPSLNVRTGPGTNFPVTSSLGTGATVRIRCRVPAASGAWLKLMDGNYVAADFVTVSQPERLPNCN